MKLWQMNQEKGDLGAVMPKELQRAASLCGISPIGVREVFHSANVDAISMQIAKGGSPTVETSRQVIPDFLIWVSMPIFSKRAASLAMELGCSSEEFWPCRFQTNPDESYFFHLPTKSFDIIDYEKSRFLMTIPGDPPLPMFIQEVKVKQIPDFIPSCFRASIPGVSQVLLELFVRDDFRNEWEQGRFSGATFLEMSN
jgi:hypothetical protein